MTSLNALREEFYTLPASQRAAVAAVSIIECNRGSPLLSLKSMAGVITTLAQFLPNNDRIALAEFLRDCADCCERLHSAPLQRIEG